MAVAHSKEFVLELLGKDVSFDRVLPYDILRFFPSGIHIDGKVLAVLIELDGNHQILVDDVFYQLNQIQMK